MPLLLEPDQLLDRTGRLVWVSDHAKTDSGWVGVLTIAPYTDLDQQLPEYEIEVVFEGSTDLMNADWLYMREGVFRHGERHVTLDEDDLETLFSRLDLCLLTGELWEQLAREERMID